MAGLLVSILVTNRIFKHKKIKLFKKKTKYSKKIKLNKTNI